MRKGRHEEFNKILLMTAYFCDNFRIKRTNKNKLCFCHNYYNPILIFLFSRHFLRIVNFNKKQILSGKDKHTYTKSHVKLS